MNRAFLVGINAYPGQPLNGCVNDVNDMADFLVKNCGFQPSDIRLLVDSRATTDNIKERLSWLTSGAAKGDRLLFHYSGHGALFPERDNNGDIVAVHDCICPVDFDWTREHALFDDDLRAIIDVVPTDTEFIYVSDSCNSGDLTRVMRQYRPKYFQPPADIAWRLRTARSLGTAQSEIPHDRCGLISGCKSDQESADAVFNNRPNGALTYYLLNTLKQSNALSVPLTSLVAGLDTTLNQNGYTQQPQLRGPDSITGKGFLSV
jgi:hypothetical protein